MAKNIPDGVKLTMDCYARETRNALGHFRRAVTLYNKRHEALRTMGDRFKVDSAADLVYGRARMAAHYAFSHGLVERVS